MPNFRRTLLSAILLVSTAPVCAQWTVTGTPTPTLAPFDQAMQTFMQAHSIPSGAMAVTWQGRLVMAHGYTLNPGPNDILVQPQSLFRIASCSKQITSVLINRLIQDGKLSLTDTIGQFIDLTPPAGQTADPRLATITIRNLLEHLAGFGDNASGTTQGYDPMFDDFEIEAALGVTLPISQANIIEFMDGKALVTAPGTTYRYSNYGYMLLGRVIEKVTGMPYAKYAASILNPIDIWDLRPGRSLLQYRAPGEVYYDSGYTGTTVMDNSGSTVPYEYGGFNIENMDSHGGWVISAVELARFLSNLDNPTAPNALLNQTSITRMFSLPQNYPLPYNPGDYYYAEGWAVRNYGNNLYNTWHDGSLPSTTAYVVRTEYGWDYAVLLNRRDESGQTDYASLIDSAMWTAYGQITQWPTGNEFPSALPVIFENGFDP
ncbi:MAG: beta-lactamase family protein [Proteobacteria bacterium]|nr:beta-lactamase family protein [Pseudomonadota bacterium]